MKLIPTPLRTLVVAIVLGMLPGSIYAQYCTPGYFQGCAIAGQINDFSITGAAGTSISDIGTGCSGTGSLPVVAYLDHTSMSVSLAPATSYTVVTSTALISITSTDVQIFIDFNNNNSFLDAGESVGGGTFLSLGAATNIPVAIPAGAAAGAHRMRVVSSGDATYPGISPCPTFSTATIGEVHDYTVNIITSSCAPVTGLIVSAITSSSADVSWTAVSGATGYQWAVTTSPTPPASGTFTTLTAVTASPLSPATTYYAHVRTQCGTDYSTWVTSAIFTTLPTSSTTCAPVTGITMSSITSGSANLSWAAVSGAIGYEWAVTTSGTPPASGTLTTLTSAVASGLSAATVYYAHVRTKCSATLFSTWTTTPFTTLPASTCPPISGLTASAITTSGATVSWTAITSGSVGYQYVIDNTVTAPLTSGTNTTATSTSPSGLTAATTYYAHVRDSCGVGDFSPWSTIPFTTLAAAGGCNAVTGLSVSGVTTAAASLSWTMASGAVAAKWVVDNNPADPTVSGTLSTTSSAAVSGLTASTLYYAHVRDTCGPTSLSAWVTIPFTTLSGTTGIAELNTGNAPFSIAVHPNPVSSTLHIQVSGIISPSATVTLADVTGHIIRHINIANVNSDIDMGSLPQGIYLVRYSDAGYTQTLRVTKQ